MVGWASFQGRVVVLTWCATCVCVTVQVKQSRTRGGCAELDAAELRAKEQEAARAAAELLEQLEKEEAVRAAAKAAAGSASAKKKKKGGVHCDV
jgi:hypothetical protein